MTMTIVPESAQNVSDNFAGFSNRRSVSPQQFFASLDQDDTYHLQLDQNLRGHPIVSGGMRFTLAAIKSIGSGWGHISLSEEVKVRLCTATGFEAETIRKHIAELVRLGLVLRYVKSDGEVLVIHAGPHKAGQDKAHQHLADEMTKDYAARAAREKKLAKERARKAAARKARSEMKGNHATSENGKQGGNQTPPEPPFSGADPGMRVPKIRHAHAEFSASGSQENGMRMPSLSMGVRPSYKNLNKNLNKNQNETTTPISARPSSVEKSAREDAAREDVVVFSKVDFVQEQAARDPMDTDPFSEDGLDGGHGLDGGANTPPPAAKPTEPPLEAAKKAVNQFLGTRAVTAPERAFSLVVMQIADEFKIPTATVESLVDGVPKDRQATALTKALADFKAKDPKTITSPWGLMAKIAVAKAKLEIEAAAKAPVIYVVVAKVDPLCTAEAKSAFAAYMDALTPEQAVAIYAEAEKATPKNFRPRKGCIELALKQIVAEQIVAEQTG